MSMTMDDLERITKGMQVFIKYNADTRFWPSQARTFMGNVQEEQFSDISEDDRNTLESYGWKRTSTYMWKAFYTR